MTKWVRRVRQFSAESITTDLQSSCGLGSVHRELYGTGLHAATGFQSRPSCPTSVCDLTNVLLEEWSKILINTLLNLEKSPPGRVEAVMAAKGGPTSY